MNRHRSLTAWTRSHDLAVAIHRAARLLPPEERFELGSQLRRAATSVTANIAEGLARRGAREFSHFLSIALGSLAEIDALLALIPYRACDASEQTLRPWNPPRWTGSSRCGTVPAPQCLL
jgi:four helix bundle protein